MRPLPSIPGVEVVHRWVDVGPRIHVAEAGPPGGPTVVLLHGWPQHWWAWRRVMPLLAPDVRVLALDLRGFGWSDAPPGDYAKETLARDVVAVLEAEGLEDVVLAGHDWGGFVSCLVCLRAPARIRGHVALGIVHPWAPLGIDLKGALRASYQFLLAAPGVGAAVQRRLPFVETVYRTQGGDRIWSAEERSELAAPFHEPERARAASALYRTFLVRERAEVDGGRYDGERLTVPTRLVVGRADPVITPERVTGWEDHADDMAVEWVDGGHWLPEERPDVVADRVRSLLA